MIRFLLLSVFVFIRPVSGYSSIQFYFEKSEKARICQEQIQTWIDEINGQLPVDWIPDNFILVSSENIHHFSYSLAVSYKDENDLEQVAEKVIYVAGDCNKTYFIHEYGHLVLDHFMRRVSPPWQYFAIWAFNSFYDIDKTHEQLTAEVKKLKKAKRDYEERIEKETDQSLLPLLKKVPGNFERSIKHYQAKVDRLNEALEVQSQSPVPFNRFKSSEVFSPYLEVFADGLAVLIMGDWSVIRDSIAFDRAAGKFQDIVLPELDNPEDAFLAHINHRDFRKGFSVEDYNYTSWEVDSPYYQFAPVRSIIRETMENNPVITLKDMIEALGLAVIDVYENELIPHPESREISLLEKNRSLARSLEIHLDTLLKSGKTPSFLTNFLLGLSNHPPYKILFLQVTSMCSINDSFSLKQAVS